MSSSDEAVRCANEHSNKFFTDSSGSRMVEVIPCPQEEMVTSVRNSYFLTHSSYTVLLGSPGFNNHIIQQPRMYMQPQFPTFPPMMYYYPTAMPLNTGYGGAAVIPPIMRYRSYITPDMIDYNGFNNQYNNGSEAQHSPTMEYYTSPIPPDYKKIQQHTGYTQ